MQTVCQGTDIKNVLRCGRKRILRHFPLLFHRTFVEYFVTESVLKELRYFGKKIPTSDLQRESKELYVIFVFSMKENVLMIHTYHSRIVVRMRHCSGRNCMGEVRWKRHRQQNAGRNFSRKYKGIRQQIKLLSINFGNADSGRILPIRHFRLTFRLKFLKCTETDLVLLGNLL